MSQLNGFQDEARGSTGTLGNYQEIWSDHEPKLIVIGDIHGKLDRYLKLLSRHGGAQRTTGRFRHRISRRRTTPSTPDNAWFLRGNHDNPEAARSHAHYLGDYGSKIIDGVRIFQLSGAWSSDQWRRTEGMNWWRAEELGDADLQTAIELYAKLAPDVVLTHEGPEEAVRALLSQRSVRKEFEPTRTSDALNAMLKAYRPNTWILGHWHNRFRKRIGATEYRCLQDFGACRIDGDFRKQVVTTSPGHRRRAGEQRS